jgi:hypothetical protein
MVPEPEKSGRRRQRQRGAADPAKQPGAAEQPSTSAASQSPAAKPRKSRERGAEGRDSDRGWRELAGSSPSQVGVGGAMRARDVARPAPTDYETAERELVIVRRDWQPPTEEPPAPVRR